MKSIKDDECACFTYNFMLYISILKIEENISLKPFNTFLIDATARYFAVFDTTDELQELLYFKANHKLNELVLGGGSNVLFTHNFNGIVLKNNLRGINLIHEDAHHYYVKAAAGESWNFLVQFCIQRNYSGIENMSLIPGSVGASPIQNIGAYGVETKDIFESLEAMNRSNLSIHTFSANDCAFGYRDSIFKTKYKNEFVITSVTFRLNKQPNFNINYGAIQQELEQMQVKELSVKAISQAVINIRTSKLPDPKKVGNAGSFFKNPIITKQHFNKLKNSYADMPGFAAGENHEKVAAGWLIEQCGWKGYRHNDAGVYVHQALVLVNYGNASGNELYELSTAITNSVKEKFDIELEREVNII